MSVATDVLASKMRLKHFRLIKEIDEAGSLIRAAEAIAISQPGATKMLNEIESVLGQRLFERTKKGLMPNAVGQCVIRYSRLVLSNLDGMQKDIAGVRQGAGGYVSIGAVMGAVPTAASMAAKLSSDRPNVKLNIRQSISAELLDLLDKGAIDIAICRTSVSQRPEEYDVWAEIDESVHIIANVDHPCANLENIELTKLSEYPWIVCMPDMPMRRHFEREFINASVAFPQNVIETASALAVSVMLEANRELCSMQPSDVVRQLVSTEKVVELDVALTTRSEPYQVVTRKNRVHSFPIQLALKHLTARANRHAEN